MLLSHIPLWLTTISNIVEFKFGRLRMRNLGEST